MRIVITDFPDVLSRDLDYEVKILHENLSDAKIDIVPYVDENSWIEQIADADALLTAFLRIDGRLMDKMPKLKCIALNSSGYDGIQVEDATGRNIAVIPIYEYCTQEVADHTMALMLALQRGLKHYSKDIDERKCWQYTTLSNIQCIEGQTLGICGFGKIGKAVAKRAQVFGMKVIVYSPHCTEDVARSCGVELVTKDALFRRSDVISNHMAQSTENNHFFDKEVFESMKDTAFFINVGRGSAVDEEALANALDAGEIAGAGLDVLENEDPNLEQCRLTNRENVILTPHAAFYSNDSLLALQKLSCMNLIYYVKGEYEKVSWIVNGDKLGKISRK